MSWKLKRKGIGTLVSGEDSDAEAPTKKAAKNDDSAAENDSTVVCEISKNRRVSVRSWQGKPIVDIREFYVKDGKQMPGKKENDRSPCDLEEGDAGTLHSGNTGGSDSEEILIWVQQLKRLHNLTEHALRKNQPLIIENFTHEKSHFLSTVNLTGTPKLEQMCLQALAMRSFPNGSVVEVYSDDNLQCEEQETCTPTKTGCSLPAGSMPTILDTDLPKIVSVIRSCPYGMNKVLESLLQKFPKTSKSQLRNKVREISDFVDNRWQVKKEILDKLGLSNTVHTREETCKKNKHFPIALTETQPLHAVMRRAQSMAHAAWTGGPSLRLSSWSCIGPRRRAVNTLSGEEEEVEEGDSPIALTETQPLSSSAMEAEMDASVAADGEELAQGDQHLTEVEMWHQLEHELYDEDEPDADVEEIRKEEAAAVAEVGGDAHTQEIREVHRFLPAGRIMHIITLHEPEDELENVQGNNSNTEITAADDEVAAVSDNSEVGIFLTPRALYSKLRLSKRMVSDHFMPSYRRQIEKAIADLEKQGEL